MKKRLIVTIIIIVYAALLIQVMVFKYLPTIRIGPLMLKFSGTETGYPPNFVPFKTILHYLSGYNGSVIASVNLVGNIGLLVPIGFFVPFLHRNRTWKKVLVLAVAAGLAIEVMQVVFDVGIFDVDDIILNAVGVMLGYGTFVIFAKWFRSKKYLKIIIVIVLVVLAAFAGLFYIISSLVKKSVKHTSYAVYSRPGTHLLMRCNNSSRAGGTPGG